MVRYRTFQLRPRLPGDAEEDREIGFCGEEAAAPPDAEALRPRGGRGALSAAAS